MKTHHGWAFPDADVFMVGQVRFDGTYQIENLQTALRYVTNFACAIDGGAHVGTWSKVMSQSFDRVVAVEPSQDTFECLELNLTQAGCTNVERRNVAIGDKPGSVRMDLDPEQKVKANTGARFVRSGGTIPVETIDSWNLPSLGFLKLDIEGSEVAALLGAKDTIARCQPIVLFENKKLWTRHYGLPKDAVAAFLTARKYHRLAQISCDEVWGPR